MDASCGQRVALGLVVASTMFDDGTRMAHGLAGRHRTSGDEGDHWLGDDGVLDEGGRILFVVAADLAEQDDRLCFRVAMEQFQVLSKILSLYYVSADRNTLLMPISSA
jgi:hypothetical protein